MESSRRNRIREELGFITEEEHEKIVNSVDEEQERRQKKDAVRQKLESEPSYKLVKNLSNLMDKFFLDAIVGFFVPGIGDMITCVVTIPYLYVSLFKIKSVPLTLAVLYNTILDCFVGLVPYIGDVLDIFHRSYKKNYGLIVGYVEDDPKIKSEVNRGAVFFLILSVVLVIVIYFLFYLLKGVFKSVSMLPIFE